MTGSAIVLQKHLYRHLKNLRKIKQFIVRNDALAGFNAADSLLYVKDEIRFLDIFSLSGYNDSTDFPNAGAVAVNRNNEEGECTDE